MDRERTCVFPVGNGWSGAGLDAADRFARTGDSGDLPRLRAMLLSDRDITAAIAEGRLGIEPYDAGLVQPSSIDVRLDRFFRVFNNSRYTHIDPAQQQDDLTTLVEPDGDEPFVLHPGEFVLGSTLEVVTIPDDLAARLEGNRARWAGSACSPTRRRGSSTRASPGTSRWSCPTWRTCRSRSGRA